MSIEKWFQEVRIINKTKYLNYDKINETDHITLISIPNAHTLTPMHYKNTIYIFLIHKLLLMEMLSRVYKTKPVRNLPYIKWNLYPWVKFLPFVISTCHHFHPFMKIINKSASHNHRNNTIYWEVEKTINTVVLSIASIFYFIADKNGDTSFRFISRQYAYLFHGSHETLLGSSFR